MKKNLHLMVIMTLIIVCHPLAAQNYKSDKLRKTVDVLGLQISPNLLFPNTTNTLIAKDGRTLCLRTDPVGDIEHIGIPLFREAMRMLQPSPVYDFLEYAVLNWKYKVTPNQLYLSKVIFKQGSWETLLREKLSECECTIQNYEDKLYIVSWKQENKELAIIGIPIEYELLNNDTRRDIEKSFINELETFNAPIVRPEYSTVSEDDLSIYGTEGVFVIPGKSYITDLLNQNVYYKLSTIYETVDTVIRNKPVTMTMEAIMPVVVRDAEFPAETFANLIMCDDSSIPDIVMELDFHLSNYHRRYIKMPLSKLKVFFQQQGCRLYFACNGVQGSKVRGVMFASNLSRGYNHLFSLSIPIAQLTSDSPTVQAEVYLYIPPIDKDKLFGTAPTNKSGIKFNLP